MYKPGTLLLIFSTLFYTGCQTKDKFPEVTTLAGNLIMGSVNGKGSSASFANPMGVAADEHGNIFVADSRNNLIRKINQEGLVSTIAGTGAAGSADGKGDMATFFFPEGVAVDKTGNVYVADTRNSLIRKISPEGFVTTLAGQRVYHTFPGLDTTVRFDNPAGITVDSTGNVYVADFGNNLIRIISQAGKVLNIAGSGRPGATDSTGSFASFYLPGGIVTDVQGNIYVADTYNNRVRKITPGGVVTTLAGNKTSGSANGKGTNASFSHPAAITIDPLGNLFVGDAGNNKIRKITPDGIVTSFAGSGMRGYADGRDTLSLFNKPFGLAADKSGNIYVADCLNNLIRRISY